MLLLSMLLWLSCTACTDCKDAAYYYRSSMVYVCVCLLDITMSRAKTTKLIAMPFGVWTQLGLRNHILGGGPDSPGYRAIMGDPTAMQLFIKILEPFVLNIVTVSITVSMTNHDPSLRLPIHQIAYFWQFRCWSFCSVWVIKSIWFEDVQITQIIGTEMSLDLMLVNNTLRQGLLRHLSFIDLLFHRTLNKK